MSAVRALFSFLRNGIIFRFRLITFGNIHFYMFPFFRNLNVYGLGGVQTLVYVLVVLICLRLKVRDVGVSNLAITDPSSATPPVCFFDLGSWCRAEEAKGPSWTGFWKLCDSYIPCSKDLLVAAVARNKSSLLELKTALLWECQDYHDRLQCQGLL